MVAFKPTGSISEFQSLPSGSSSNFLEWSPLVFAVFVSLSHSTVYEFILGNWQHNF